MMQSIRRKICILGGLIIGMKDFFGRGRPLAIAMWDFSWLERRGPGEGFED